MTKDYTHPKLVALCEQRADALLPLLREAKTRSWGEQLTKPLSGKYFGEAFWSWYQETDSSIGNYIYETKREIERDPALSVFTELKDLESEDFPKEVHTQIFAQITKRFAQEQSEGKNWPKGQMTLAEAQTQQLLSRIINGHLKFDQKVNARINEATTAWEKQ